jgi:hypothetical protein
MKFETKNFDLTVEHLSKKLGLPNSIDVDYNLNFGKVLWIAEVETREWGIKSIIAYVTDYEIEINWEIEKLLLNTKQIQHLLQNDLGEFYPAEQTETYIKGKIRLDNNKYVVNNEIELAGDLLSINEIIVSFDNNEITVL